MGFVPFQIQLARAEAELWTPELENSVELVDQERDALFHLDGAEQRKIRDARPWRSR